MKYFFEFISICLSFKSLLSKWRSEWNLKEGPKYLLIKYKGIIFLYHSWKQSYSFLIQEHLRLTNLKRISTLFTPALNSILSVSCLILGDESCHIKDFCIFAASSVIL